MRPCLIRTVRFTSALVCSLVAACAASASASDTREVVHPQRANSFAVVGYLPEWRYLQWTPEEHRWRWDALSEHLTHLIIFSLEVGSDGSFAAMDRFPPKATMDLARTAAKKHKTKLLLCFGGNSRTNGFPVMVSEAKLRKKFLKELIRFSKEHELDGVDYNWEYPKNKKEWNGLFKLIKDTRSYSDRAGLPNYQITMAYYPDKQQETLLSKSKVLDQLDLMHMMSYDQHGEHSTWQFGKHAVDQGLSLLPANKLTMGLPMYARSVKTGQWTTYEDIIKLKAPEILGTIPGDLEPGIDKVGDDFFNGVTMIHKKTKYALDKKLGGVMIWESGQDHFVNDDGGYLNRATSLHAAITNATINFYDNDKATGDSNKDEL